MNSCLAVLFRGAVSHRKFLDCEYTSSCLPASTKIAFAGSGQACTLLNLTPSVGPQHAVLFQSVRLCQEQSQDVFMLWSSGFPICCRCHISAEIYFFEFPILSNLDEGNTVGGNSKHSLLLYACPVSWLHVRVQCTQRIVEDVSRVPESILVLESCGWRQIWHSPTGLWFIPSLVSRDVALETPSGLGDTQTFCI